MFHYENKWTSTNANSYRSPLLLPPGSLGPRRADAESHGQGQPGITSGWSPANHIVLARQKVRLAMTSSHLICLSHKLTFVPYYTEFTLRLADAKRICPRYPTGRQSDES